MTVAQAGRAGPAWLWQLRIARAFYVYDLIKGKLIASEKHAGQAANNTKEQFANSPDLAKEIMGAVMDALRAHWR